jgi:hypothetical protein
MANKKISDLTSGSRGRVSDLIEIEQSTPASAKLTGAQLFGANEKELLPTTSATEDDEFDANTLDAKWTWNNQGSASVSFASSCARFQINTTGARSIRSILQTVPAGNWTITCKLTSNNVPDSASAGTAGGIWTSLRFFGLTLRESGTDKRYVQYLAYDSFWRSYIQKMTSATAFSATPALFDSLLQQPWYWLRIQYDGTSYIFSLSYDGIFFQQYLSDLKAAFFTTGADQFGICMDALSGNKFAGTVDYFRLT